MSEERELQAVREPKEYLIHCPYCGKKFPWSNKPLDDRIYSLKEERNALAAKMNLLDANPNYTYEKEKEMKKLKGRRFAVESALSLLNEIRRRNVTAEMVWRESFKETVIATVGIETYYKMVDITRERIANNAFYEGVPD